MYLLTILEIQIPIYLNRKPQKFSPFWGKLFVFFVLVVSNLVFAQIHVSDNATLSVSENAYIYTETEVVGNHDAVAVYKDSGILLVAKSNPKEKSANQKTKQNALGHSKKHIAKTEKPTAEKSVYQITSQPASEKFSSAGADSTLAVFNNHYRELGVATQTLFIKKHINNIKSVVFGSNSDSENNHLTTTPKTRPPPLSFREKRRI